MMRSWLVTLATAVALACGGSVEIQREGGSGGGLAGKGGSSDGGGQVGGSGGGGSSGVSATPCQRNSECIVRAISCCGRCGAATRGDAMAIHVKDAAAYQTEHCSTMDCPACDQPSDPTLLAVCDGVCKLVDLLTSNVTVCAGAGDCRIRSRSCCECGAEMTESNLLSIREDQNAEFESMVCDPMQGCDGCVPSYPGYAQSKCEDGHCVANFYYAE